MKTLLLLLIATVFATSTVADSWTSTSKSSLRFAAKVDGGELPGTFKQFSVKLETEADGSLASFEVTVNLAAADLGDSETNETLAGAAWFNTEKHAQAVFTSDAIVGTSQTTDVSGTLDLKGLQKTVSFPVQFSIKENSAFLTGSALVNRNDFNVGSGEWSSADTVGLTVELNFEVELARER